MLTALIRQRNRKLWGVQHPLDIGFDKDGENAACKQNRELQQEDAFTRALDAIQDAIESDAQRAGEIANLSDASVASVLHGLFFMNPKEQGHGDIEMAQSRESVYNMCRFT